MIRVLHTLVRTVLITLKVRIFSFGASAACFAVQLEGLPACHGCSAAQTAERQQELWPSRESSLC